MMPRPQPTFSKTLYSSLNLVVKERNTQTLSGLSIHLFVCWRHRFHFSFVLSLGVKNPQEEVIGSDSPYNPIRIGKEGKKRTNLNL
jgi:hypothetical protein